jgi:adenosine deaminase CECR1
MLMDKAIPADNGVDKFDNAAQMRLIVDCVNKKREKLVSEGKGDLFPFGLKIIYCTPRSIPDWVMRNEMKECIELKIKFRDLICGRCLPARVYGLQTDLA